MEPTIIPTINNLVNTGQVVNNSGFGFVAIFILLGFLFLYLSIAALVLWIWSIVNVAKIITLKTTILYNVAANCTFRPNCFVSILICTTKK